MCGLVGVAGTIQPVHVKVFKQLLFADTLRGKHSTGVLSVGKEDKSWHYRKDALTAEDFLCGKENAELISAPSCLLMGHNRHATVGGVTSTNAHPFKAKHIVGAHNGTLTSKWRLLDNFKFSTDSEALYNNLAEEGVEKTYGKLQGAWALTWWDDKEETLNFLRNSEREFSFCYSADRKILFWASESKMLEWILSRNKITHTAIVETKTHSLYSFKIPKTGQAINDLDVTDISSHLYAAHKTYTPTRGHVSEKKNKPAVKKEHIVEAVVSGKYVDQYGNHVLDFDDVDYRGLEYRSFCGTTPALIWGELEVGSLVTGATSYFNEKTGKHHIKAQTLVELDWADYAEKEDDLSEPLLLGFEKEEITEKEFKERSKDGCAWCSDPISTDDEDVHWVSKREVVCGSCAAQPDVNKYWLN